MKRDAVKELEALCESPDMSDEVRDVLHFAIDEITRLRALSVHWDETTDEYLLRNFKRGVPLEAMARHLGMSRGITRQRLRKLLWSKQ